MVTFVKISDLPPATTATGDSELEVNQQGQTRKITVDQIIDGVIGLLPPPDMSDYVAKTGDTMSGPLVLPGNPAGPLDATDKLYVDAGLSARAPLVHGHAQSDVINLTADLALKAPLASPTFTGIPAAPTPATGDNDTSIATTAFVKAQGYSTTADLASKADITYVDNWNTVQNANIAQRVLVAGDVMSGPLEIPGPPTLDPQAANKLYVDDTVAANALYRGVWQVALNNPDLEPTVANPADNWSWICQTADPAVSEVAPIGLPGIGGELIDSGWTVIWNESLVAYEIIRGPSLSFAAAQGYFVDVIGDTMTGPLTIQAPLEQTMQATPAPPLPGSIRIYPKIDGKYYSLDENGVEMPLGGASLSVGDAPPAAPDDNDLWWDSDKGEMYLWFNDGTSRQWVPASAPPDLNRATADLLYVDVAGDTMLGTLTLAADPTQPLEAATMQYVDAGDAALDLAKVNRAGDTMTGPLVTVPPRASPAGDLDATNKFYVDQAINTLALYRGIWNVAANTPDLTAISTTALNGWSWMAQTVDPLVPEFAPAGVPGIAGLQVDSGDRVVWDDGPGVYVIVKGSSMSIVEADARYVNVSGDSMDAGADLTFPNSEQGVHLGGAYIYRATGRSLMFRTNASNEQPEIEDNDGSNRRFIIDTVNGDLRYLNTAGDTTTGFLTLNADPTAALHATTKQYVDAQSLLHVLKAGDTMTGQLTLPATAPVAAQDATPKTYVDTADLLRVLKAGDVMTGALTLPADPTTNFQAATKQYVDSQVAAANLYQGLWQVAANNPDLNVPPATPLNGYTWIAVTVDPQVAETAPAGIPGIGGTTIFNGDSIKWNATLLVWERIQGSSLTKAQADSLYVALMGDTMTGELILPGVPTDALAATDKTYVDAADVLRVLKSGDVMTGALTLPANPTNALEAATKQYVDGVVGGAVGAYLPLTGGTTTGSILVPLAPNPTADNELAHKQYVDETVASNSLYQGIYTVSTNTPDLAAGVATNLNGFSWICQTVDPAVADPTIVALPGVPLGTLLDSGWTIRWNGNTSLYELIRGPSLSLAAAQGFFVDITGDQMTGKLLIDTSASYTNMLRINKTAAANNHQAGIEGSTLGDLRWSMYLGSNDPESGTDYAGSNFVLYRWNNAGTLPTKAIQIDRLTNYISAWPTYGVDILINKATPKLHLASAAAGQFAGIQFYDNGTATADLRWHVNKTSTAEGTGNTGSNFQIDRFTNTGTYIDSPLHIRRGTGEIYCTQSIESHHLLTRGGQGGTTNATPDLAGGTQLRLGYNNQTGATYAHEIRTGHHGSVMTDNRIQFWLHGSNQAPYSQASADAPNHKIADFGGDRVHLCADLLVTGAGPSYAVSWGDVYHGIGYDSGTNAERLRSWQGSWDFYETTNTITRRVLAVRHDGDMHAAWTHSNANVEQIALQVSSSDGRGLARLSTVKTGLIGGNNEGKFRVGHWMGGWGYRAINFETQVGPDSNCQLWIQGRTSSPIYDVRSSAHLKQDIRHDGVIADAVKAFDALQPSAFRFKDLEPPVDENGALIKDPRPFPEQRERFGFIVEEMPERLVTGSDDYGNQAYDLAQLLAVAVAKIKQLEARIDELKESRQ